MMLKPIRNKADHAKALARIEQLMSAKKGSREGDELDVLVTLVSAYEDATWPTEASDPVTFLHNCMDLLGHSQAELGTVLGSRSRASEVLKRKRPLTLDMIRRITDAWGVPADPLIKAYDLVA